MRWIQSHIALILIYGTCFATGMYWVSQRVKFHDVRNWPSVEARVINSWSIDTPYHYQYRDGPRNGSVKASHVSFDYSVDGRDYRGDLATPDGGELPPNWTDRSWRAYHKPGAPHIAVLHPAPYQGTEWLLAALMSGILIAIHVCVRFPDWMRRCRRDR
ncbi:MAG: DUF3592 domain-containing protein [Akkermansiaceae bacterium]|nr:DUF3592 domain-containing protein [Akkermansiaceae bacterium]MCP5545056.1 DUF3592 domain-containing protein [Akkermansiaceae bacterium]MCP5546224.1 DUF3592 domain-containing protein [Akkermansiaceae bacterium]